MTTIIPARELYAGGRSSRISNPSRYIDFGDLTIASNGMTRTPPPPSRFLIGDRIIGRGIECGIKITKMTGTVIDNDPRIEIGLSIQFDQPEYRFHSCDKRGLSGFCFFVKEEHLLLLQPRNISNTRKCKALLRKLRS